MPNALLLSSSTRVLPLALALTLSPHLAISEEVLDETVVTASRIAENYHETFSTLSSVDGTEFFQKNYRTIPEALLNTPGVMVQKTTHGHGSPFVRGFTGRQNLILVDGIRINNSTWRSGPVQYWNTVDGNLMDRLELVRSQGSVQYGSDALGGTLNVLTRGSGFQNEQPGWFWGGSTQYRFDTNSRSHVGRVETRFGQGGSWGVLLGAAFKDFGDIKDSALGRMRNTGYPEQNYDLKFEALLNPDTTLTVAHQYLNQDDVWRWHSTVFNDTPWNGTRVGTFTSRMYDQERSLSYIRLNGESDQGFVQSYALTLSLQQSQDSEFQNRTPTDIRNQVIDLETYGIDLQLESALAGGVLVYGVDYYQDEIDSAGSRTGRDPRSRRPVADDSTYHLFGAFAQYRREVATNFELGAGARFTYAEADLGNVWNGTTDISASEDWSNVVFNVRGLYHITDQWNVYGGASQGFRAPNANDLSGNITSRSGQQQVGSLDLDPEDSWTFELGTRVSNDTVRFGAAAFYTMVDDLIISVPVTAGSNTVVSTNAQEAYITGIEVDGSWRFHDDWTLSGHLTWQEGETDTPTFIGGPSVDAPVSRLSPLIGSVALRYNAPSGRWWVEARVTAADKQDELSARDMTDTQRIPPGGTPSYLTTSIHAGIQATENIELTLGLENLTDEDYRVHGSGVNAAGFNAIFGARIGF